MRDKIVEQIEQGLASLEVSEAADLLGVDLFELLEVYLKTKLPEMSDETILKLYSAINHNY